MTRRAATGPCLSDVLGPQDRVSGVIVPAGPAVGLVATQGPADPAGDPQVDLGHVRAVPRAHRQPRVRLDLVVAAARRAAWWVLLAVVGGAASWAVCQLSPGMRIPVLVVLPLYLAVVCWVMVRAAGGDPMVARTRSPRTTPRPRPGGGGERLRALPGPRAVAVTRPVVEVISVTSLRDI